MYAILIRSDMVSFFFFFGFNILFTWGYKSVIQLYTLLFLLIADDNDIKDRRTLKQKKLEL